MDNQLYSYEEVCNLIREKGLKEFEREDATINSLWQFGERGSSLHVNTFCYQRFELYATEKDFNLLKKRADEKGLSIMLRESKKDDIDLMISGYESVGSKAILFYKNGNKGLLQIPTEKNLPHKIIFFTNENLEFVLDVIHEGELTKAKSTSKGKVQQRVVFVPKPKEPEMTVEEIEEYYSEGCIVSHSKYGQGTVKEISEGKIAVTFEGAVEKVFAARICIDKKILTYVA
ncbi:MAG: hypothetical protein E7301_05795 [Butyrivibrio sp.]|nr:hypothetical protein [Butyrivibrio sp.]